jgi:isopentenyl-diphosphate delta-isomerase type 1
MTKPEDIFDIVDARDRVIGSAPRSVIHAEKHRHRAVHLWLRDRQGRVLLQFRSRLKQNHPAVWDSSVSGHVDTGESYAAAAVREMGEEIGVSGVELREIASAAACAETEQEFVRIYVGETGGPFVLQEEEVERVEWFEPGTVSRNVRERPGDFAPAFAYLWRKHAALLQS